MVANIKSIAERFVPAPQEFLEGRWRLPRFTYSDAMAMVRIGIIPEDASTELLNGMVVLKDRAAAGEDPSMIGQDHRKCVERLCSLRKTIDNDMRHVESQQPLMCSETHVPEPDFMVLRGTLDDSTDLPTPSEVFCVAEVADASYERDAGEKLRGYARAGIEQYIIINLRNRTAEVYSHPDLQAGTYPAPTVIAADAELPLRVAADEFFPVLMSQILP
jgi:Uma2 family endonuclease